MHICTPLGSWRSKRGKRQVWRSEPKSGDGGTVRRYYGSTMGSQTEQLETRARYYGSLIGVRYGEVLKRSDFVPRAVGDICLL